VMTMRCHRMRKFIIRLLQWEVGVGDVELGVARQKHLVTGYERDSIGCLPSVNLARLQRAMGSDSD